eukprot:gene10884-1978_t
MWANGHRTRHFAGLSKQDCSLAFNGPFADTAGAETHVFKSVGKTWRHVTKLQMPGNPLGTHFGGVAVGGDVIALGMVRDGAVGRDGVRGGALAVYEMSSGE